MALKEFNKKKKNRGRDTGREIFCLSLLNKSSSIKTVQLVTFKFTQNSYSCHNLQPHRDKLILHCTPLYPILSNIKLHNPAQYLIKNKQKYKRLYLQLFNASYTSIQHNNLNNSKHRLSLLAIQII